MTKKVQKVVKTRKQKPQKVSKKHSKQQEIKEKINNKTKNVGKQTNGSPKLPRGRKLCHNCKTLLYIHQSVCPSCKSVHHMKRSKEEILKSLAKKQPKALRGILESNQFNQIAQRQIQHHFSFQIQNFNHLLLQKTVDLSLKIFGTKQKLGYNLYYSENPKICIQKMGNDIIFVQLVKGSKKQVNIKSKFYEEITIKAFQLEYYHKIGAQYTAKSYISCFSTQQQRIRFRILIEQDILLMKSIFNKAVCLTGKGQILILTLPEKTDIQSLVKQKQDILQLQPKTLAKVSQQNQYFTTLTILQNSFDENSFCICVGTLSGNIIIYKIIENNETLPIRVYANAHYEHITCISECPLSTVENFMFCSGSYDGSVKVWQLKQAQPLFSVEVSNKKVMNLIWDFGAKFILAIRDETPQNCIMICFYSVHRTEETINLSNQAELRPIKIPNSSYLSNSDQSHKIMPVVDSIDCKVYLLSTEQLRKSSLKKKKHTQQKKIQKFNIKINLLKEPYSQNLLELPILKSKGKSRSKGVEKIKSEKQQPKQDQTNIQPLSRFFKAFPVVSDLKHYLKVQNGETVNYIYGTTFKGHIFQIKLLPNDISNL